MEQLQVTKTPRHRTAALPEEGYVRLPQIIGDPNANPPIPPVIPVSKATWYAGIKMGRYPAPTKKFGDRISAWDVKKIRALLCEAE